MTLLLLAAPSAAGPEARGQGETPLPCILHMCDVADWAAARHGRDALLAAADAGGDGLLVATGGALTSCGAPRGKRFAFAAAMLDAAGFDVVNLAHRDLAGDPKRLAAALKGARAAFVSASFRMPAPAATPWKPFAVVERGGRKVAFIGVAGRSPAMDLPASGAIEGLRYVEPQTALRQALAQAGKADAVVVLGDAGLSEAAGWLREFERIDAAIVSGRGGVSPTAKTPQHLWLSPPGGAMMGRLARKGGRLGASILRLYEPKEVSAAYRQVAERFGVGPVRMRPGEAEPPTAAAAEIKAGETIPLAVEAGNRAALLTVRSVAVLRSFGGRDAPAGKRLLVIDTQWENVLTPAVIRDRRLPVAYKVARPSDHLYCVADGRRLLPPARIDGVAGVLADTLMLPRPGSTARGRLIYEVPASALPETLSLRHYDFAHGHIFVPLVAAAKQAPPQRPVLPARKNEVVELGIHGFEKRRTLGGRDAPAGMTFVTIDLRGRSLSTFAADATAFDPKAKAGAKVRVGTVADWKESRRYMQLVADGEYAYVPDAVSELPAEPRLLPDIMTGGRVVFLAPRKAASLELRCDFPNANVPGRGTIRPGPITFTLEGERPKPPRRDAIASVEDVLTVSIVAQDVAREFSGAAAGAREKLLVLTVTVANPGNKGEWFQTKAQLRYLAEDGTRIERDEASRSGLRPAADLLWVPPGRQRTFQIVFRVGAGETKPRIAYRGFTKAATLTLRPIAAPPAAVEQRAAAKPGAEVGEPSRPHAAESPPPRPKPTATKPQATQPEARRPATREVEAGQPKADPAELGPVKVGEVQVFHPDLKPKGLPGVGLTAEQVNRAIEKGRKYLWELLWEKSLRKGKREFDDGDDLLACLALVHAEAGEVYPQFDVHLRRFLKKQALIAQREDNYEFGILSMLAASYGDPAFYHRLQQAARYIVESQGPGGTWYYQAQKDDEIKRLIERPQEKGAVLTAYGGRPLDAGDPLYVLKRTMKIAKEVADDGDNSVTQFAVLGLWTASRSGLGVPKEAWKRCLDLTRKRQNRDGGWDYRGRGNFSYGSMTCAGVCTTAICLHHLGGDPLKDPAVQKGLAWLIERWTVARNPMSSSYHYYYLYSLERVGRILGVDFIGGHEWYPVGAKHLVDSQKADGSWEEDGHAVRGTSFALLFLTKATATLKAPLKRGGAGTLRTSARIAGGERFYFILDASGSMAHRIKGRRKFNTAREALWKLVGELPPKSQVALRVYGQHERTSDEQSSKDTHLEIEMGPLDKDAFLKKLKSLQARGMTPLALSLDKTREDLAGLSVSAEKPVAVVLLTDGGENAIPRRNPVKAAEPFARLEGAGLYIVGFDITRANWTKQLQAMADAAGGQYWPVAKADDLQRELRSAVFQVPQTFTVLDEAGEKVAAGRFGDEVRLKEGRYVFHTSFAGRDHRRTFWINTDAATAVVFDSAALTKAEAQED
jgi:hypothetical protein